MWKLPQVKLHIYAHPVAPVVPAIFPHCKLHMTFAKDFTVVKKKTRNIFRAPVLQSNLIIRYIRRDQFVLKEKIISHM